MNNRRIDISAEGKKDFELAIQLSMGKYEKFTTKGYRVFENKLVLYWTKSQQSIELPYEMNIDETINFVWGWLQKTPPIEQEPDHDGDNGKGFRIFNDFWGHVFGEYQAFIAIEPIWAMYGK